MAKQTLLLNYVFWRPVGHLVEAMKYALGFKKGNKDLEVHVCVNKNMSKDLTERLCDICPWITRTYVIDLDEVNDKGEEASCLRRIPRDWDFIVDKEIHRYGFKKGYKYDEIAHRIFTARIGRGKVRDARENKVDGLKYKIKCKVELKSIPAAFYKGRPKICIMLGGASGYRYYPDIESWVNIVNWIKESFPKAVIYVTGVTRQRGNESTTQAYDIDKIKQLTSLDRVVSKYNIGIWNQLALVKACDVFISPHTGFAFLSLCVGTPWLALSGGDWPEYFFNYVPFYSLFPDDENYPYGIFEKGDKEAELLYERLKKDGKNYDQMTGKIDSYKRPRFDERVNEELVEAIKFLTNRFTTYRKALSRHKKNISRANIRRGGVRIEPKL